MDDDNDDYDGVLTAERDRQPIDRGLLWEMLKLNGFPPGVRKDAPDFDVLAGIPAAKYREVVRLWPLEKIKIGQEDFLRFCNEHGIKPPKSIVGGQGKGEPNRQRGRRPASLSKHVEVWALFEEKKVNFTFERGELTRISKEIADATGYRPGTVADMISPNHRELKQKAPPK